MPTFLRLSAALLMPCLFLAAEEPPMDADLPQAFEFDAKVLSDMRTHSPFNRFVRLEDTIRLTGVAYVNGKPMATLLNKDTKQRFVISDEPNAMGWTLTEATLSDEPSKTEVHVVIGADEVVLHYSEIQPVPADNKSDKAGKTTLAVKGSSSSHSHASAGSNVDVASLLGSKGKELLGALSPEARGKLAGIMESSLAKHPERSTEENAALAQKMYAKMVSAESKAQNGSTKTPRPSKPPKKK